MGKLYHMPYRGGKKVEVADPEIFAFRPPGASCPLCGTKRVEGNLFAWCVTPCHGKKSGSITFEIPERTVTFKGCAIEKEPHVHCHSVCCSGSWVMQRACDVSPRPPRPSIPERLRLWLGLPPPSPDTIPHFRIYALGIAVGSLITLIGLWILGLLSFH